MSKKATPKVAIITGVTGQGGTHPPRRSPSQEGRHRARREAAPPPPSSLNTGRIDHLYQTAHKTGYFTVTKSDEKLTLYQFNTNTAKHYFCSACGIYTYH